LWKQRQRNSRNHKHYRDYGRLGEYPRDQHYSGAWVNGRVQLHRRELGQRGGYLFNTRFERDWREPTQRNWWVKPPRDDLDGWDQFDQFDQFDQHINYGRELEPEYWWKLLEGDRWIKDDGWKLELKHRRESRYRRNLFSK
jgi:hypothetical protein